MPRKITDRLAPWDLENLTGYDEKFLSGFRSEVYQVDLDEGFDLAVRVMDRVIRADVARDIGGDHQRITQLNTRHSATTFKHILLPIWVSSYRYNKKVYRFLINARTGETHGERPYDKWKIAITVLLSILAVIIIALIAKYGQA